MVFTLRLPRNHRNEVNMWCLDWILSYKKPHGSAARRLFTSCDPGRLLEPRAWHRVVNTIHNEQITKCFGATLTPKKIAPEKPSVTNVRSTVECQVICCASLTIHNFLNVPGNEILLLVRAPFSMSSRSQRGAKGEAP